MISNNHSIPKMSELLSVDVTAIHMVLSFIVSSTQNDTHVKMVEADLVIQLRFYQEIHSDCKWMR